MRPARRRICSRPSGTRSEPGLILSGHTDVVPVDGQNWDTDPFKVAERDGKLYARGSADMKGFIGVALSAGADSSSKRSMPGGSMRRSIMR